MNVRFPGLGLEFKLKREAFSIFNISIYWYGIIIAVALLVAVLLALRSSKKFNQDPDKILDVVLFASPVAIIFSRLYYVIFNWEQYKDNPIDIIKIRDGGLAIYGAVIGALLTAWVYTRVKKISFLELADFAIPYFILGQAIGRWGNFVNQEAFGTQTNLLWRMNGDIPDAYLKSLPGLIDLSKTGVHPTFLYESLWDFAVFFFLIFFRKKKKLKGEVLSLYLVLYGIGRFFIEGLRTDSLMLGGFRVSQLLSLLFVLIITPVFIYRRVSQAKKEESEVVLGQSQYGALLMKMKEEELAEAQENTDTEKTGEAETVNKSVETEYSDSPAEKADESTGNVNESIVKEGE